MSSQINRPRQLTASHCSDLTLGTMTTTMNMAKYAYGVDYNNMIDDTKPVRTRGRVDGS
jgi:hypothetical protein